MDNVSNLLQTGALSEASRHFASIGMEYQKRTLPQS